MTWTDDILAMIDQRFRLLNKQDKATGTVVDRDSTGYGAQVLFSGSTTAVPVKCFGSVLCRAGDRVGLQRFGSDWIIVGAFTAPAFGEGRRRVDGLGSVTGGLTSSTFVDLSEFGSVSLPKAYDVTSVRVGVAWQGTSTANSTRVGLAVRFTPTDGAAGYTATDYGIGSCWMATASVAVNTYQTMYVLGGPSGLPAGTYTVTFRWRRVSGTGTVTSGTADCLAIELDEYPRSGYERL